jgi:glycogen debranching enzyme
MSTQLPPTRKGLQTHLPSAKFDTLRPAAGNLEHPYLVPGNYDQCWDWDSYFIALAISDEPSALPHIRGTVENFFAHSDEAGRPPRWLHPKESFFDTAYVDTSFANDLAKPFLAQTALIYSNATGDANWFRPYLEKEKRFLNCWREERMAENGLHVWASGLESGGDNHPDVFGWPDFSVEGVDLAVFLVREHFAAAILAHRCGEYSLYQYFLSRGRFLLHQMTALLYDHEQQTFCNRFRPTGQRINIASQSRFYAFWLGDLCGLSKDKRAHILQRDLLDPERFWSPHGLRSLDKQDPIFNNTHGTAPSNWQGPIWIVGNYINLCGLIRAGLTDEATQLADRIVCLLARDIEERGEMSECYHSETGAPLAQGGFLSWNLLAARFHDFAAGAPLPCSLELPSD